MALLKISKIHLLQWSSYLRLFVLILNNFQSHSKGWNEFIKQIRESFMQ